jgi:hypothetical protein
MAGAKGVYTRKKGLDRDTNKALLLKHIKGNKKTGTRLEELLQVLPALTYNQVQTLMVRPERRCGFQKMFNTMRVGSILFDTIWTQSKHNAN